MKNLRRVYGMDMIAEGETAIILHKRTIQDKHYDTESTLWAQQAPFVMMT